MTFASKPQNPKFDPPLGLPSEVIGRLFPAQITARSLARVPETNLDTLVEREKQIGHIVRFRIDAHHASFLNGSEPNANQLLKGLPKLSRLGYVVVSGAIISEHCGDELNHYKSDFIASASMQFIETTPKNGFLPGMFRLIAKEQAEQIYAIHDALEPF